jgi:hypothetical protein
LRLQRLYSQEVFAAKGREQDYTITIKHTVSLENATEEVRTMLYNVIFRKVHEAPLHLSLRLATNTLLVVAIDEIRAARTLLL